MTPESEAALKKASEKSLGTLGKAWVNTMVFSIFALAVFAALPCLCTFAQFCSGWWKTAFHAVLG